MRIWFDTEFYEDGRTIELISIGAVREDGAEFYAETLGAYSLCAMSDWLRENVEPHLRCPRAADRKDRTELAREFRAFAGEFPEFWAYYADYDWVALCQLFGRMIDLPAGWPMYCRDLKQLADQRSVKLPAQESGKHDALADARWAKSAHEWLVAHVSASVKS